jgi:tetratricopeptide (TPR) repeat protein
VRTTYLNLSRQLHPDKLAELGVDDNGGIANKLFAHMGHAFAVLTDQNRRTEYMASLLRPDVALPPAPPPPRTKTSEEVLTEAAEACKRGEAALRRDEPIEACLAFAKAVELQPNNTDYSGLLGWAQFCAATDKAAAAMKARQALDKMINKSDKLAIRGRFLLGRVERMLGNDQKAKYHFELVLYDQPNHTEAQAEIRAIELRARNKR